MLNEAASDDINGQNKQLQIKRNAKAQVRSGKPRALTVSNLVPYISAN
jgi:hypothetical protein